ncbi:heat shock factor binding protein 1 [Ochromonadaceae sp. CCMP2298]|nr:heat shock factor binding protein 1 [Ochromonadaceae sp. CCMP2298]|mmetsp:Transcript_4640/g.10427  ORF Transcript_4640/g.10427 Transcript_4640/m.10427 type:complete len:81 (-) Transcript_4640:183-425(-)|eukprot:CAMPEP_0173186922 /NCGR_PEP_ID=MMETSP1141-20130122/10410_1 /TAXON_ID=483371 /ORGANISM="non described non described, Strain CCMP2298" /LENGTH=80 /DNA_ID=CAMNT_0014110677 /DNA_START=134 /DNA_END=376 /DNA_ORIENTATION=+
MSDLETKTNVGSEVPENAQDLTIFVQNLLEQMQQRFNQMSTSIIGRIDEMGNRIDDLEKSIGDLMVQAGVDPKGSIDESK